MTQVILRTVLTLTLGVFAFACSKQFPSQSLTSPSATPQPPIIPDSGPTIPVSGSTLSGHVYEVTSEGLRAVSFGNVWYSVDGSIVKIVNLDTSGRFTISALPKGSRIRLTANSVNLQQTCAVYIVLEEADAVRDIKLVRSGTHDPTCEGARLSGEVFRIVDGEKRPLKNQRVGFYSADQWGGWDVYAITNSEGRFEFAGLARGAGSLLAGDCSDAMDSKPIEIRGNANVVDFDLTAFIQSCPWYFLPQ
jgi:hypothetical protein